MLIQKQPTTGDVVAVRLITGEEIVGKITKQAETTLTLAKPVVVQLHGIQGGQAGIGFAPFSLAADDAGEFSLYVANLLSAPVPARSDIAAAYIKATTGLEIAQAPGGLIV